MHNTLHPPQISSEGPCVVRPAGRLAENALNALCINIDDISIRLKPEIPRGAYTSRQNAEPAAALSEPRFGGGEAFG